MFAFLCPIRHPDTAEDYEEILAFLRLTIESISKQKTSRPFVFYVVCNQKPQFDVPDFVRFVVVDFPSPDQNVGTKVPLEAVKKDKGTKIAAGLLALKDIAPDYIYMMDGDDWFNVDVVESLSDDKVDMWYADSGYVVDFPAKTYIKKYGICRYCGSTYVFRYKTIMQVTGLDKFAIEAFSQQDLLNNIDDFTLRNILGNHRHQIGFFRARQLVIKKMPLAPVAWLLNTGQNHSAQDPGKYGFSISKKFVGQFGVTEDFVPPHSTTIKRAIFTCVDSLKSLFGWLATDKTKDKI